MAGFFAKLYLFAAAYAAGLEWLVVLGLLNSAISLYYYSYVIRQMYVLPARDEEPIRFPAPAAVSLVLAVVGVLALGILSDPFVAFAQSAAAGLMR